MLSFKKEICSSSLPTTRPEALLHIIIFFNRLKQEYFKYYETSVLWYGKLFHILQKENV